MNKKKVVVSIGGSILIPDKGDSAYIGALASILKEVSKERQVVVVCGGGKIARYYTSTCTDLGGSIDQQDILGIGATRLNATLLAIALGDLSSTDIPLTAEDAAKRSKEDNIVVMGGTTPGHTTDAVATMVAKEIKADVVINATSVNAVYSDDPRTHPDAEKYSEITIDKLGELVYKEHGAGKSSVFDPLGVKIAKEEKIDISIVDGRNLAELKKAMMGETFDGTLIHSR